MRQVKVTRRDAKAVSNAIQLLAKFHLRLADAGYYEPSKRKRKRGKRKGELRTDHSRK